MKKITRDTTKDLFLATLGLVKENGHYDKAAAIMDYILPNNAENNIYENMELSNYRFDFNAVAQFGGSEGIYIDCFLSGEYSETENTYYRAGRGATETERRRHIGTFKTLKDDISSFMVMGELCGALTFYAHQYVNQNIDRYTPTRELEREEKLKQQDPANPCPFCPMEEDCFTDHTDVRHMYDSYIKYSKLLNRDEFDEKSN
jgi:hypothetical protein